jgi:hypothetical protein
VLVTARVQNCEQVVSQMLETPEDKRNTTVSIRTTLTTEQYQWCEEAICVAGSDHDMGCVASLSVESHVKLPQNPL